MTIILNGTTGITTPTTSTTGEFVTSVTGFKNRIINGAMVIDQRNAGAATANTVNGYTVDRWQVLQGVTGKLIAQQNAGAITPPVGFSNYLGVTSQSAYTVAASDYYLIRYAIEGFNTYDLAFGTANAASVALSFWVRSSLTGTFSASLQNSAGTRSYPFNYTISAANTWEQKTITIAGDTSGTWVGATNASSFTLNLSLGIGSNWIGTANAWAGVNYFGATNATSVVGTNGATFYITGVQLEKGSTATSFDYRDIGTELALCQRYYETTSYPSASQGLDTTQISIIWNASFSTGQKYLVAKRAAPTVTIYGRTNAAGAPTRTDNGAAITGTSTASSVSPTGFTSVALGQALTAYSTIALEVGYTASSEL